MDNWNEVASIVMTETTKNGDYGWSWASSVSMEFITSIEDEMRRIPPLHAETRARGRHEEYFGQIILKPYFDKWDDHLLRELSIQYAYCSIVEAHKTPCGKDQIIHRDDSSPVCPLCLTVVILMEDVPFEKGPTEFFSPSWRAPWNRDPIESEAAGRYLALGRKGDVYMYTSRTQHLGVANQTDTVRRALFINFEPPGHVSTYMEKRAAFNMKLDHGYYSQSFVDSNVRRKRMCTRQEK